MSYVTLVNNNILLPLCIFNRYVIWRHYLYSYIKMAYDMMIQWDSAVIHHVGWVSNGDHHPLNKQGLPSGYD